LRDWTINLDLICSCCNSKDLDFHSLNESFVSSDSSKSFFATVDFYQCRQCLHISKVTNSVLDDQINLIYEDYNINSQSINFSEQKVLDSSGVFLSRSAHLINKLQEIQIDIPKTSFILDFGCG
jgi:hypothetical protein